MNAYRWASVALAVVVLAGSVRAADEIDVIAVAKVGDGSATAKAWDAMQAGAQKAAVGRPFRATPADWLVQIKPMPCPEAHGAKMYSCAGMAESTGKDGAVTTYSTLQSSQDGDWIAVKEGAGSGPGEGGFAQQLALMRGFLEKAGQPLSDAQEKKLAELVRCAYPEADEAWAKAKASPEDKALAAAFVRACLKARDAYQADMLAGSNKMMAVFTPEQLKAMGAPKQGGTVTSSVSATSNGPGSFSVSSMRQGDAQQMVVVISEKRLSDAYASLVQCLNGAYGSKLATPEIPADLAGKIVSAKLVLENADGALEKLAAAAGAKLVTADGKTSLVAEAK